MKPDDLSQAESLLRAGRPNEAEALFRRALGTSAEAAAREGLGRVALARGQPGSAPAHFDASLTLKLSASAYFYRGLANLSLNRRDAALADWRESVRLEPGLAQSRNNLANLLWESGQHAEAREHWQEAVRLDPAALDARLNLSHTLIQSGEFTPALEHAQAALRLAPTSERVQLLLGQAHAGLNNDCAAAEHFGVARRLRPDSIEALAGLGLALSRLGRHNEAIEALESALRLQPNTPDLYNALGAAWGRCGQWDRARACLESALRLHPNSAQAHHNLAVLLLDARRFDDAAEHLARALELQPGLHEAAASLARAHEHRGDLDAALAACEAWASRAPSAMSLSALGNVLTLRGRLADAQSAYNGTVALDSTDSVAASCRLVALLYDPNQTVKSLAAEHRAWADRHARVEVLGPTPNHDRHPDRPLRVGYLSHEFGRFILSHFLVPLFVHHDPTRVELHAWSDCRTPDGLTRSLRERAVHWHSIHCMPDDEVARLVRAAGIDILVDLDGHCGSRLGVFARRPAPVQVSYLGYPAPTELDAINYRLTDDMLDPPGEGEEPRLVRLLLGFCCFAPSMDAPEVGPLPALKSEFVTFVAPHKLAKLNGQVLDLWAEVLRAVPDSRLLLYRDGLRGTLAIEARSWLESRGVESERILIGGPEEGKSHLEVYTQADVVLDVFPWSGHATACEALWQGVPVLTLRGGRLAGRMVASVLTRLGLSDWVAETPADYARLAVEKASDLTGLATLRAELRERMRASPVCRGREWTRTLEDAYRELWRRWCCGGVDARSGDASM